MIMFRRGFIVMLTIVALLSVGMLAGCSKKTSTEAPQEYVPTLQQITGATQKVIVYYRDASGYVLPVSRNVEKKVGIGKAALECLVAGGKDDEALAARGIFAPIPQGTQIDLDIGKDGAATVNLKMGDAKCASAEDEKAMLASVVNTLLEFSTVKSVKVWVNGKEVKALQNGTAVDAAYAAKILNVEPVGAPNGADGKLQLYFGNEAGAFLVPVYRLPTGDVTPLVALQELQVPLGDSGLISPLPDGCQVLSVTLDDKGTATVDVTKEFLNAADKPGMEWLAWKGISSTLGGFKDVKDVKLTVDGKAYELTAATLAYGKDLNPLS